jgi:hypothetical protein
MYVVTFIYIMNILLCSIRENRNISRNYMALDTSRFQVDRRTSIGCAECHLTAKHMPVLTWYRTLLHFQFALLLLGLYPSKHYLSPCNKLHFCLTIVTPEHNASSEGTITPNYLEKMSLARTLTRVLLLICFVWERRYDNKEITCRS